MDNLKSASNQDVLSILESMPAAFCDVNQQRRSDGDLEHLAAYLETLLLHIPVGVIISEAPSGRVLYGNERMEHLRGKHITPPKNIGEYDAWRGFHPDGKPYAPHEWPLARAIEQGEIVSAEEIHIERSDGVRLALLVSAAPVRDKRGEILAGIVVDQDITEHKRTSDALLNSIRLETDARLAAETANQRKDQFIAMVSHELRTPLNPIAMTLTAMELDARLPKDLQGDIAMLRRNLGIEIKLIDDLLDVTSINNGKFHLEMKPAGMHALLRQVAGEVARDMVEQCKKLTLTLDAQNDTISGDPVRLHQVFWNILQNAIKFTPAGGEIWIRSSNPTPGQIAVEVQDGGIGIASEALPHIFDAFVQEHSNLSRPLGGLGIGLTVCKAIVDLHGGTIRATSAGQGKGACFRIELPVTPGVKTEAKPQMINRKPETPLRLLVVDDHQDTLRVLRRLLEALGYRVATAASSADALRYAAGNRFDVLVSDIGLPDVDGYDLLRQLKRIQDVPAIAISGYGSSNDKTQSRDAGFCGHLTKPLDLNHLHATIQQAAAQQGASRASSVASPS